MPTSDDLRRVVVERDHGQDEREEPLEHRHGDEQPAAVEDVGEQPADEREEQQRAELGEQQHADERRRLGAGRRRARRAPRSASSCRCSTGTRR